MEPGPSHSELFEGRRSEQREILMERIKALRSVPRSENAGTLTDSSGKESTRTNILPSFGSLSAYKIDRDKESALFDLDAARLLDSLEVSNLILEDDTAIRFPDQATPDHWLTHLNPVLRSLMCSLAISAVDDISVLRAHKIKFDAHGAVIKTAGQRLQECQMDTRALGYTRIIHPSSYWDPGSSSKMDIESTGSISDSQAAGYYAIVDYITAIVARLLASGFEDEPIHDHKSSWHAMTLTILAKVSAKMKVLGHCLSDFKIQVDGESTPGRAPKSQDRLPLGEAPLPSNPPLIPKSQGQLPPGVIRFVSGGPPPPPPPPPPPGRPANLHQPLLTPALPPIPPLPPSVPLSSLPTHPTLMQQDRHHAEFIMHQQHQAQKEPLRPPPQQLPPLPPLPTVKSLSTESLDTISTSEFWTESDTTSGSEGRSSDHSSRLPNLIVPKRHRSHKKKYLSDMSEISTMVFHILWRILSELEARSIQGQRTNEIDISAIVYATGTQKTSAMLYQDAGHEVRGSQTGVALGVCRRMFDTIRETADAINSRPREDEGLHLLSKSLRPQLRIRMSSRSVQHYPAGIILDVRSMSELISIMIPLSCMNPGVADRVLGACSQVGASDIIRRLHAGGRDFTATVSLCSVIEASMIASTADGAHSSPLSQARFYLRQSGAESALDTMPERQTPLRLQNVPSERVTYPQLSQPHCHQSFDAMRKWAIDGTTVTVRCLNYTLPVMAGCGGLVTGGLLAGFLVGERITGVDPFNLTMFCWIIAGFIVLVAKSIRVATWPWRDFLLGRVTTRSVSELASVTGLDEQLIILYLLSQQVSLPLIYRGPFNRVFSWGEEVDTGFSIDIQPTVRTLFASGIVVLEVLSSGGPALICIDLRPEMNRFQRLYMTKIMESQHKRVSLLACVDPPKEDDDDKNMLVFKTQRIRWERVIGVYNDEDGLVG